MLFVRYARFATPQQPPGLTMSDADRHETPLTAPQLAQVRSAWVRGHEPRIDGYGLACRYDAMDLWTFSCSQVLWDPDGPVKATNALDLCPCASTHGKLLHRRQVRAQDQLSTVSTLDADVHLSR